MHETQLEISIAYIHGRIEAQLEGFANALGVSTDLVTARISELLRAGRPRLAGAVPLVPERSQRKRSTMGKVEVARDARNDVQKKTAGKGRKIDRRWRNADGTLMNREERHTEQRRRQLNRSA